MNHQLKQSEGLTFGKQTGIVELEMYCYSDCIDVKDNRMHRWMVNQIFSNDNMKIAIVVYVNKIFLGKENLFVRRI